MSALIVAHIIEDVEFQLRSPVAHVGDSAIFQIAFRLLRDIARVVAVTLARDGIEHIADQIQRGNFTLAGVGGWLGLTRRQIAGVDTDKWRPQLRRIVRRERRRMI